MSTSAWKTTTVLASGCALFFALRPVASAPDPRNGGVSTQPPLSAAEQSSLYDQLRAARSASQACQLITRLDGAGGAAPLLEVLDRTRLPELRRCAVDALARIDRPDAIARLTAIASDGDAELRGKALAGLARSADARALATVVELATTATPSRRTEALVALAAAGRPEATELLLSALDSADEASQRLLVEALGDTHDPAVVPALGRLAAGFSPRIRGTALRALGHIGDAASIALLEDALNEPTGEGHAAAQALASIEDPAARRALLRAAGDHDESLSTTAIYALRGFDGDDVKQLMLTMLSTNDRRAGMACDFFVAHPDPAATRRLIELARHSSSAARQAVLALRDARGPETTALMLELADQGGPAQLPALGVLRGQPGGGDLVRPILLRMAADGGDDAGEAMMLLADDHSPAARRALVDAVRGGGNAAASAAFALVRRGDTESLRAVEELATSPRKSVRQQAVMALSNSKDPHALETLERCVADPDDQVRSMALNELLRRGGPRAEALAMSSSSSKNDDDRELAINGLARLGTPAAMARLKEMTTDANPEVARSALDSVIDKEPEQGKAMLNDLMHGDGKSRKRAVQVASSIDVELARPLMLAAVHDSDPEVVLLATRSISRIGGHEAQAAMLELLRAPASSPALRKAAAYSLDEMGGGANDEYRALIDRYRGSDEEASDDEGG